MRGDDEDNLVKIAITFVSVLCIKQTSARFTPKLYDSYDRIVELTDSDWLMELKEINEEDFDYWKPKHYVLYLVGIGMYQFIAQTYEVKDMMYAEVVLSLFFDGSIFSN